jgi:hypothetical protein
MCCCEMEAHRAACVLASQCVHVVFELQFILTYRHVVQPLHMLGVEIMTCVHAQLGAGLHSSGARAGSWLLGCRPHSCHLAAGCAAASLVAR